MKVRFFASLVCSTGSLLLAVTAALAASRRSRHPRHYRSGAVYLALFAYPLVSVKVVDVYGCHKVAGSFYLRADYSVQCYTQEWYLMAAYASVFLVTYVDTTPGAHCHIKYIFAQRIPFTIHECAREQKHSRTQT